MRLLRFWIMLVMPPKFYGGGGGKTQIVDQNNAQQRALANVATQKWDWYQSKYVPLENRWMGQVERMDDPTYHNEATGMATTAVKQANGPQTSAVGDTMTGQRLARGNYVGAAMSEASGATKAHAGVTDRMLKGEQGIVAMGQGQSAGAIHGLDSVAQRSVQGKNNDAANRFEADQDRKGMYGAVAGMGTAVLANKLNQMGGAS